MTASRGVRMELTRLEAAHLAGLVGQFADLLDDGADGTDDPAVARLVPDGYSDDDAASEEFRALTERDLLTRRREDAAVVLDSLADAAQIPDDPADPVLLESVEVRLEPADVDAWLRTLAAVRLVLATRLGISSADDHDEGDPRFGIYDWLGYRLHGLVTAIESDR
ncbi:DUF2017 family protein [Microbacterium hominis]|uniref:DUF2017 family protein n=1 Tax=Microbacterium hominis TaxID=162426 RepID=A0A7D4PM63_9MICO|nr:DUF2017 family protein [Microbacterium hominis]QKJ19315.1 DUF2017 family protein [Microbacterium hominis]